MSFSQARIAGENLFLEIVVNGCYDCPMKYGVSETCFLIGSCGLNRNRTCVEHNCPAPVLIGENVGIILHAYTEKKIAPQNTIETGDTAHNIQMVGEAPQISPCEHEWLQACTQAFCRKCHAITDD